MDGTAREYPGSDTAAGEAAAPLVESALQLRWRAPELALLLADRAAASGDETAELLAAGCLNRLGREVEAGQRALAGLRRAATGASEGDRQRRLRIELAAGAVAVGAAGAALAVLRPVLEAGPGTGPDVRAAALVQLAAVLTALERADAAAAALREADDLYQGGDLEAVPTMVMRATVRALQSAHHRRHGQLGAAESAAREGLELLSELSAVQDGGAVGGRLVLELVLVQLDRGEVEAAAHTAAGVVGSSVRAAAAPSRGWLHLALATRVYLPAGRHREALDLLGDAIDAAERHMLDPVLAECLEGLCRVHEQRGEYAEALRCLRSAHAAGYRHRRACDALRMNLIEEFVTPRRDVAVLADQLAGLIETTAAHRRRGEPPTGLLDMPGFVERAEVALAGAHPGGAVSLAAVAVDPVHPADAGGRPDPDEASNRIAEQLREMLPARGVLGRLDSERFAVLLPDAGRASALDWARGLRASVAEAGRSQVPEGLAVTVSVGVAEYDSGDSAGELLSAADRALGAARRQGGDRVALEPPDHGTAPASADQAAAVDRSPLEAAGTAHDDEPAAVSRRARHRRDDGQQLPVAELLSAAGLDSGGSRGRRRAEEHSHSPTDAPGPAAGFAPDPATRPADPPAASDPDPLAGPDPDPLAGPEPDPPVTSADEHSAGCATSPWTLGAEPPLGSLELVDGPAADRQDDRTVGTDRVGSGSECEDSDREGSDREIGLGDLLAGALAAFEEGRRSGLGNEQVWQLPERRRRSAAGD